MVKGGLRRLCCVNELLEPRLYRGVYKMPSKALLLFSIILNIFLFTVLLFRYNSSIPAYYYREKSDRSFNSECKRAKLHAVEDTSRKPYIFIGGVPSSGTTLMRVILDAHPDIRCGEETRLVPRILQMRERWRKASREHLRLDAAGLNDTIVNIVVRNFISNVIELHGPPANVLCNKDPLSLAQMKDLHTMFPRSKFILLIRDGRGVAHSIVSRNVSIGGVNSRSYLSAALFWNRVIERMWANCESIGPEFCLKVYFENLVSDPKQELRKVLNFVAVPWHDNVLHHQLFINSKVSLSRLEPSTKQVVNPITKETAIKWKKKLSRSIQEELWNHCPMLRKLGYTIH